MSKCKTAILSLLIILFSINSYSQDLVKADQATLCAKGCVTEIKNPEDWDISAAFGLNATQGNANSSVLSINTIAQREIMRNLFRFEITGARGEQENVSTGEKEVSQEFIRGDASYKYLLGDSERAYLSASGTGLYDKIAQVDYRAIINPAFGYFFLKDDKYKLNGEAGPSYIFEKVDGISDDYLAPRVAERFEWVVSPTSKFFQAVEFIMDVNDTNNYLLNGEVGIEAAIATNLALVFSARNRMDNQPAPDREKNDTFFTTAIKVRI